MGIWVWVNTYRYIFSGMNIHLPAILGFTRYQGFDPSPYNKRVLGETRAAYDGRANFNLFDVWVCRGNPEFDAPATSSFTLW